jgi:hypothetical protein
MDRLLAKSPDDRYPTPAEAAAALEPFLGAGSPPAATALVPAFKAWLESESQLELPRGALPADPPPAKPAPPAAAVAAFPRPGPAPGPAALTSTPRPVGVTPRAVPAAPPRRAPRPPADEVDVELVPDPAADPFRLPAPVVVPLPPEDRPLTDLDRRDWIMLTAGAVGVLAAAGLGYVVARFARKKPEDPPPET